MTKFRKSHASAMLKCLSFQTVLRNNLPKLHLPGRIIGNALRSKSKFCLGSCHTMSLHPLVARIPCLETPAYLILVTRQEKAFAPQKHLFDIGTISGEVGLILRHF